jgi:hypothetical protein
LLKLADLVQQDVVVRRVGDHDHVAPFVANQRQAKP